MKNYGIILHQKGALKMTTGEQLNTAIESLDIISDRLRELSNLINTVHQGLVEEEMEKQTLDCIMCFLHSVNDLHKYTEHIIKSIKTY